MIVPINYTEDEVERVGGVQGGSGKKRGTEKPLVVLESRGAGNDGNEGVTKILH